MMYQKMKNSVLPPPPPLYKCIVVLVAAATLMLTACSLLQDGSEKSIRINLPPIVSASGNSRSISDDRIPTLKTETRRYRVTVNGMVREGTESSYEFTLTVGIRATVTVECLNSSGEVIIRAVKDFTVAGGDNIIDINLKADGDEIINTGVIYSWGVANNGGDKGNLPANEKVAAGETFTVPNVSQTIYWEHGNFNGWSASVGLEPDAGGQPVTNVPSTGGDYKMPGTSVTLTAQWNALWYAIDYDTSFPGGAGSGSQASGGATSFTMAESDNKALSTSSDNSGQYAFKGWATASGASAANISGTADIRAAVASGALQISSGNNGITLYAVWSAAPFTINYTVAPNEGTGSYSQDFSMADTNVTLYNGSGFSRKGYNLAGWNYSGGSSNAGNKGDSVSPSNLIQNKDSSGNTVTLTARWEEILYGIEVDPNGATSISMVDYFGSLSYTVGSLNTSIEIPQSLSATDYEYRGKVFDGLAYTPTGAKISTQQINVIDVLNEPTAQISSSNVITLYAVWKDAAAGVTINGGPEQFYDSFDAAWNAMNTASSSAPNVPYVVKMYENATVTSSALEPEVANITLDLNGFTLTLDGAVIAVGGLVSGEFTLADSSSQATGTIKGTSYAAIQVGGGQFAATFNMTGGKITGVNSSDNGGGVSVKVYGTFNMSGGTITGNTATDGGGVYVDDGTFNMSGGTISGNTATGSTATGRGGGVYVATGSTFNISGNVQITGNQKNGNAASNVYLAGNGSAMINLTGTLNAASRIGVTLETSGTFTSDWNANKGSAVATTVFTSDVAGMTIAESGGELELQ